MLPARQAVGRDGGTHPVRIAVVGDWDASSDSEWVVAERASGSGNASVLVTVAANPSTAPRVAIVDVSGEQHTVTQEGSEPTPSATPSSTATATFTETPTAGACNADGRVAINELVLAVSIALGNAAIDQCANVDTNRDGSVSIAELVTAVGRALNGC